MSLRYAELQITTNFSFLRGASRAQELVEEARALGLSAIAVTDRNTLAGVVRAYVAVRIVRMRSRFGSSSAPASISKMHRACSSIPRIAPPTVVSVVCYLSDKAERIKANVSCISPTSPNMRKTRSSSPFLLTPGIGAKYRGPGNQATRARKFCALIWGALEPRVPLPLAGRG